MGKLQLSYWLEAKDYLVLGPNRNLNVIPEVQFFALRDQGAGLGNSIPLPERISCWNDGVVKGESVLIGVAKPDLYMIADDERLGLTLFHYVYDREDGSRLRYCDTLPTRTIQTERSMKIMSMNQQTLLGMVRGQGAASPMNLSGNTQSSVPAPAAVGDGVSGAVSVSRIQREALATSYVSGYIMGSAPAITLAMSRRKVKDSAPTFDIVAKESKPSRCLSVLIAMPARCCKKGGSMASPTDIMAGMVDFSTGGDEMVYQAFPVKAALSYIAALGGSMAEYAPHVSDMNKQWSAEAILSQHADVSFVRVHATENKSGKGNVNERFRFSLRTTSSRRSLYTPKNIVCLRALEHMPIKCTSEEDAYKLNEAAFGGWRYRKPKTETENALEKAFHNCPDQIWEKTYTIDGEKITGIGSAFFMVGPQEKNSGGVDTMRRDLSYYPWWQTGSLRQESPTQVKQMVKRVLQPAENKKKERMVTLPILYKEKPDAECFKQYGAFVRYITTTGYITQDQLVALGGRATKANRKKQALTNDQTNSLLQYMRDEEVMAAVQQVQEQANDRDIISSRKG